MPVAIEKNGLLLFYCPGCRCAHMVETSRWKWNGSADKPTIEPSLRVFIPARHEDGKQVPEKTLCHLFLRDGEIEFLTDSAHALAGKKVPAPEFPADYAY